MRTVGSTIGISLVKRGSRHQAAVEAAGTQTPDAAFEQIRLLTTRFQNCEGIQKTYGSFGSISSLDDCPSIRADRFTTGF